uniref:Secreted protein n=1 Tax=Caenorhabditis tropicalis TaxID=1561998 RepID=A0A1I7U1F1_9PELO
MNLFPILILSLFGCTVVNSVVVRKKVERKESSSSSSSEDRPPRRHAGRALSNLYYGGLQDIWVDGVRRPECPGKTSCTPLKAFQWTDGHTTGTDGFFWPGPEPNAFGDCKQGVQSVTVIHISPADGVAASYGYPHGAMNDNCYELPAKLYACGKLPA